MKRNNTLSRLAALLICICLITLCGCSAAPTEADPETPLGKTSEEAVTPPEKENDKPEEADPDSEEPPTPADEEAGEKAPGITGYTVDRQDQSVHENDRDFYMFFDVVTFQGDDPAIEIINQLILEKAEKYKEEMLSSFSDMSGFLSDSYPYNGPHYFEPRELVSVYYDESYISVGWHIDWYAGGVHNEGWESVNLSRQTYEPVSICDILGEDAAEKTDEALEEKEIPGPRDYKEDDFSFYFDAEKVYIGFHSYTFHGMTNSGVFIEIKR